MTFSFYFLIGTFLSLGVFFIHFGVQIDPEQRSIREFVDFLGIQTGTWIQVENSMKTELLAWTELNPTYGKLNPNQISTHATIYRLFVVNSHGETILELLQSNSESTAKELQQEIGEALQIACN